MATWIDAAGLDWSALVVPSQYEFNGQLHTSEEAFHMIRSDTGASLSVMSKKYKPAQPADVMAFFRDFILTDPRFQLETAGVLQGGKKIWALARFADDIMVNNERHVAYVLLTTSFDGSLATTAQATMVRVVCKNTLNASIYGGNAATVKVPHYHDFSSIRIQADAADRLSKVAQGFAQYKAIGEALAGVKLSGDGIADIFKHLIFKGDVPDKPSTKSLNQLDALLGAYRATLNEGTPGGTGWTVLNAVTRYVDHTRTARNTSGAASSTEEARLNSAWFGTGAAMKKDAIDLLAKAGCLVLEGMGIDSSLSQVIAPSAVDPIDRPVVVAEIDHERAGAHVLASILGG